MIKENKNVSRWFVWKYSVKFTCSSKKDSLVTIVADYLNKLFMRNTKDKYRAEIYKVISKK